jgi:hypothetical protein
VQTEIRSVPMQIVFATTLRFCVTCAADASFEQPECIDEHGVECPEWVCVECGDAFVVGFTDVGPVPAAEPVRHVA